MSTDTLRKRLLDKTFRYTRASETDVAKTFARIRRQLKEAEAAKQADAASKQAAKAAKTVRTKERSA